LAEASSRKHTCRENCVLCGLQSIFVQFAFGDQADESPQQPQSPVNTHDNNNSLVASIIRTASFDSLIRMASGSTASNAMESTPSTASQGAAVPPTLLRQALAALYAPAGKFALNEIDDAVEALDAIFGEIHNAAVGEQPATYGDKSCCVAHDVFGLVMSEQNNCLHCGKSSKPSIYESFVHYMSATALRHACERLPDQTYDRIVQQLADTTIHRCQNKKCEKLGFLTQTLLSFPKVLTIGLVWDSDSCSKEEIQATLECVGTTIDITHALRANSKARATHSTAYTLRGTLAYYGQHYVAFEKNPTTDLWTVFDDATVRVLGKPFDTVIATAARARLQPLLLFYERQQ